MISKKSQAAAFIMALAIVFVLAKTGDSSNSEDIGGKVLPVKRNSETLILRLPELEAKAVYVLDVKAGKELYAKNATVQLPLASLTKLMTVFVALGKAEGGELITVSENAIKKEGDNGLMVGEKWTLKNLAGLTLVSSSNDAAAAIAEAFDYDGDGRPRGGFVAEMNEAARELGLRQTYFLNETGLDFDAATSGAYGSAKDVSRLMINFLSEKPEIAEMTSYKEIIVSSLENEHYATNTNRIIGEIPGLIFSKTGYTDLAGGNLAVIFEAQPGKPVAAVVLGSSEAGRFEDMKKIVSTVNDFLKNRAR